MDRIISPPIDQLDHLVKPLTKGERLVLEFFDKHLDPKWEIYIKPHLNGLRPDFVLLNPKIGIAVFEVDDTDVDTFVPDQKNGLLSSTTENPVEKVYRYKSEIVDLYCPRLNRKAGLAVITGGIISPFSDEDKVVELLEPSLDFRNMLQYPQYNPVSGRQSIEAGNLNKVFPENERRYSGFMNENLAKDFRNWLVEPDFSATQREPIKLDRQQKALVLRETLGYRRIKGQAGSGKSLVLAARAAELASRGKRVLVVTYNLTLIHYLRDVASRWQGKSDKSLGWGQNQRTYINQITWLGFHAWCKIVCWESESMDDYYDLWRQPHGTNEEDEDRLLIDRLPELVSMIIDRDSEDRISRYDAILVDEGQDFYPHWWGVLRKVCEPGGEMLLVADTSQDIYGVANKWTDQTMIGAGFNGPWTEIKISYRMPPDLLDYARAYAIRYLPPEKTIIPEGEQVQLELFHSKLRWVQTSEEDALTTCVQEIISLAPFADPEILAIPDITFLCSRQKDGEFVVNGLSNKGIKTVNTFSPDSVESRKMKMCFFMSDAKVKATTYHSFKGWESIALVIYIDKSINKHLVYSGLTRLKRSQIGSYISVVSCAKDLVDYGSTWPDFLDKTGFP